MLQNKEHKLIQSYVLDSFFVSTIHRRASTPQPMWFYECFVWEWSRETRDRGKLLEEHDLGSHSADAIMQHAEICGRLAKQLTTTVCQKPVGHRHTITLSAISLLNLIGVFMLDQKDIDGVDEFVQSSCEYGPTICAWNRIKKELVELAQQSDNKQSTQCDHVFKVVGCDGVECRLCGAEYEVMG